tara:strand:- start:1444 stop:1683 length:240 start_codon:yes stop_codon:yes gene_type:complete
MKVNDDYSEKAPNFNNLDSMEGVQLAMDTLEWNILNKLDLDTKDLIGYALVRSYINEVAKKAHAFETMFEGKENHIYKN